VGYAVVCPLYARSYAEEKEVSVFTRALLDRLRYAEALKLVDVETLSSVVRRAARGDRRAMESLLEVGRDLTPQEVEKIFPQLLLGVSALQQATRGEAPSGPGEEAYHFYKYAEPLPYAGFADLWNNVAIYSVRGWRRTTSTYLGTTEEAWNTASRRPSPRRRATWRQRSGADPGPSSTYRSPASRPS